MPPSWHPFRAAWGSPVKAFGVSCCIPQLQQFGFRTQSLSSCRHPQRPRSRHCRLHTMCTHRASSAVRSPPSPHHIAPLIHQTQATLGSSSATSTYALITFLVGPPSPLIDTSTSAREQAKTQFWRAKCSAVLLKRALLHILVCFDRLSCSARLYRGCQDVPIACVCRACYLLSSFLLGHPFRCPRLKP